jgi:HD-GYP domain-containing protein (c-di-GMP phosphodiesterase class II)
MQIHPDIGARIVEGIPFLQESLSIIRYHHERWDGSGYPSGLKGEEIPIQARIFAVADVFDALTSRRSYRSKSSADEAIQYIKQQSGRLFDPMIVEALTRLPYKEFTEGEKVIA